MRFWRFDMLTKKKKKNKKKRLLIFSVSELGKFLLSLHSAETCIFEAFTVQSLCVMIILHSKKISNDQELIQSDPISCPQNQKGNN